MTNPPQQPGDWQEPSWPPAAEQPPAEQQYAQQPYADPYGGAPVSPGYTVPPGNPADYPGYGYPGYGYGTPIPAAASTNGMAIASLVVSIVGAVGLCAYGLGGYIGLVGAILGHVARRQVRERGEAGAGMALAGVIVGWIATAIAVLATAAIVIFVVFIASHPGSFPAPQPT
jgi:hypothetical protein